MATIINAIATIPKNLLILAESSSSSPSSSSSASYSLDDGPDGVPVDGVTTGAEASVA